jgi:glycosyltransferase involved in cell wall biosynthesis
VALDTAGVSSVVKDGETGFLAPEGSVGGYAKALHALMIGSAQRLRLGKAAANFVRSERTLDRAADILDGAARRAIDTRAILPT